MDKTPSAVIPGNRLFNTTFGLPRSGKNIAGSLDTVRSGSPAMGIVKLLRASELGFHFVRATQSRRKEG
jgi:hypothetical protein